MEQAIQLFGYLILTMLGIVLPIVAILLSIFQEGISKLSVQYETEKSQSEKNIREQLKKLAKAKDTDVSGIQQSLSKLKSIKKSAAARLSYLNPKKQIIRLFTPLILAFLGVIVTVVLVETNIYYLFFLLISLIGFTYAIVVLWNLIGVIVEVRKTIDVDMKDRDTRTIELLSALVKKVETGTGQYFLQRVYISFDDEDIKDDSSITVIRANSKAELKIGIHNRESRMAKDIEIGFILPTNFIIDKTGYYSIYRGEAELIVRYETPRIHGSTLHWLRPLIVTPLEKGDYKIRTFIKAENIESTYRDITIKVT